MSTRITQDDVDAAVQAEIEAELERQQQAADDAAAAAEAERERQKQADRTVEEPDGDDAQQTTTTPPDDGINRNPDGTVYTDDAAELFREWRSDQMRSGARCGERVWSWFSPPDPLYSRLLAEIYRRPDGSHWLALGALCAGRQRHTWALSVEGELPELRELADALIAEFTGPNVGAGSTNSTRLLERAEALLIDRGLLVAADDGPRVPAGQTSLLQHPLFPVALMAAGWLLVRA